MAIILSYLRMTLVAVVILTSLRPQLAVAQPTPQIHDINGLWQGKWDSSPAPTMMFRIAQKGTDLTITYVNEDGSPIQDENPAHLTFVGTIQSRTLKVKVGTFLSKHEKITPITQQLKKQYPFQNMTLETSLDGMSLKGIMDWLEWTEKDKKLDTVKQGKFAITLTRLRFTIGKINFAEESKEVKAAAEKEDRELYLALETQRKKLAGSIENLKKSIRSLENARAREEAEQTLLREVLQSRDQDIAVQKQRQALDRLIESAKLARKRVDEPDFQKRIVALKKNLELAKDASEDVLLKKIPANSATAETLLKANTTATEVVSASEKLHQLKESLASKYKVPQYESALENATSQVSVYRDEMDKNRAVVDADQAAFDQAATRHAQASDRVYAMNQTGSLSVRGITILNTITNKAIYSTSKANSLKNLDRLKEIEEHLAQARDDIADLNRAKENYAVAAKSNARAAIAARNSLTAWFLQLGSLYLQYQVAAAFELVDIVWEYRKGGAAGAAGETLKKAAERIVVGVVTGKWSEEYFDPSFMSTKKEEAKDHKEALALVGAKATLGYILEPGHEMSWTNYQKLRERYQNFKAVTAQLDKFSFVKAGASQVGSLGLSYAKELFDEYAKDPAKDWLKHLIADGLGSLEFAQYADAELRAMASSNAWLRSITAYWEAQDIYDALLKERKAIEKDLAIKDGLQVQLSESFLEGSPLQLEILPTSTVFRNQDQKINVEIGAKLGTRAYPETRLIFNLKTSGIKHQKGVVDLTITRVY